MILCPPPLAEQKMSTRVDCRTEQKFENNRCMWLCFLLNLQINTLVDMNFIYDGDPLCVLEAKVRKKKTIQRETLDFVIEYPQS